MIFLCLRCDCDGASAGGRSYKELHAPVHQGIIGIDGFFIVQLVVFVLLFHLIAVNTTRCIDLFNGQLGSVDHSLPVCRSATGKRSDRTDLKNGFSICTLSRCA